MNTSLTKYFLAIAAFAIAIPAFAGPRPEKNIMPEVAPACDWSGFYIGANVGITDWVARFTDLDNWDSFATRTYDSGVFIGGGHAGYNLQFGQLVLGFEGDADWINGTIHKTSNEENESDYARVNFETTFRGRIGVAFDKALVYVTGGGAGVHGRWLERYDYEPNKFYDVNWEGDNWRWGFCGGAGIEYRFDCHWSIRAESIYTWLRDDTKPITGGGGYYAPPRYNPNEYKFIFDDDFFTGRVGVSYNFGSFFGH